MVVAAVLSFTGCYNDFDDPAPAKVWTEADFNKDQIITIKQLKDIYYAKYAPGSTAGLGKYVEITEDYVIRGKVISSDQAGNVYKSLYIYDETSQSGIELKLMVSNYVYYHMGQTIYVKTKGMALGNYRYMISLGMPPTEADIEKNYANRNLENQLLINEHICPGAMGELTENDVLVITPSNYETALNDDALGRLVRFEGLTYKEGTSGNNFYPSYLEAIYENGKTEATYTSKSYISEGLTPTYAYSYNNQRYYGSAWFSYGGTTTEDKGNYIVRVSGYSNFALQPLPEAGATGDITAIYTKYSSSSGGFITYQLVLMTLISKYKIHIKPKRRKRSLFSPFFILLFRTTVSIFLKDRRTATTQNYRQSLPRIPLKSKDGACFPSRRRTKHRTYSPLYY